jgi:hypothetical protein
VLRTKLEPARDSEEKLRTDDLERLPHFGCGAKALADGIEGCTDSSGVSGLNSFQSLKYIPTLKGVWKTCSFDAVHGSLRRLPVHANQDHEKISKLRNSFL